jgi:AcrR family transcriptional regulator
MDSADKPDRRVQRTRDLLRRAMMELMLEKGYDAISIQDITDRANLGRTTFYLHYQSKDDLFLEHHEGFASGFYQGTYSRAEMMADDPATTLIEFIQQLGANREVYFKIANARDANRLLDGFRQQIATNLEASLHAAYPDTESAIPFQILAQYVAGAQISFVTWWLATRNDYAAEDVARWLHRLLRATIQDALGDRFS